MDEPSVETLLSVAEAIRIIDATPIHSRAVEMPLDQCTGMHLAKAILADRDFPSFDKSQMDGFAVRCDDVQTVPTELKVVGEIPAGRASQRAIRAGETMAI